MLLAIIIAGNICFGQTQFPIKEKNVPQYCLENFQQKYPDATSVQWMQGDPGFIDVTFVSNNKSLNATYAGSGGWVSTSEKFPVDSLPMMDYQFIIDKFPKAKVLLLWKTDTVVGLRWEVQARKKKLYEFVFDMNGLNIGYGPANQ